MKLYWQGIGDVTDDKTVPSAWDLLRLQILLWCLHRAAKIRLPEHSHARNAGCGVHSGKHPRRPPKKKKTAHEPWPTFKSNSLLLAMRRSTGRKREKYLGLTKNITNSLCTWQNITHVVIVRHSSHMELTSCGGMPGLIQATLFPVKKPTPMYTVKCSTSLNGSFVDSSIK